MKNILYSFFVMSVLLPVTASAATFSLSPNTGSFAPGDTINVAVYINPGAGENITTAKLSATFSADGLSMVSFAPAVGWIPLTAPGSDLMDNDGGALIKTGGLPGGATAQKLFGTITFKATNANTATLNTKSDSMLLDTKNANKYLASTGATFMIIAPFVAPTPETTSSVSVESTTAQISEDGEESEVLGATVSAENVTDQTEAATTSALEEQVAAATAAASGINSVWYYAFGLAIILAGFFVWQRWGNRPRV